VLPPQREGAGLHPCLARSGACLSIHGVQGGPPQLERQDPAWDLGVSRTRVCEAADSALCCLPAVGCAGGKRRVPEGLEETLQLELRDPGRGDAPAALARALPGKGWAVGADFRLLIAAERLYFFSSLLGSKPSGRITLRFEQGTERGTGKGQQKTKRRSHLLYKL